MATVNIVRAEVENHAVTGNAMPVIKSTPKSTETFTNAITNQVSADSATSSITEYWIITALGGPVWAKFGVTPVASIGNDWLILDGQTREFSCVHGQKVAVIDA